MNPTHLDFKPNNYENGFDPTQPTSTLEPNTPLKLGWRITSQNQEKLLFLALNLLVYFIEPLHRISKKSLLSEKLFGRAPTRFSRESALGALPNAS